MIFSHALIVGLLCVAWSAAVGIRQVLLGPLSVNFPAASVPYRVMLFVSSGVILARGVDLLIGAACGKPQDVSFLDLATVALLTWTSWLALVEILHKRLPASTWRRIRRLVVTENCSSLFVAAFNHISGRRPPRPTDVEVASVLDRQKVPFKRRQQ